MSVSVTESHTASAAHTHILQASASTFRSSPELLLFREAIAPAAADAELHFTFRPLSHTHRQAGKKIQAETFFLALSIVRQPIYHHCLALVQPLLNPLFSALLYCLFYY